MEYKQRFCIACGAKIEQYKDAGMRYCPCTGRAEACQEKEHIAME